PAAGELPAAMKTALARSTLGLCPVSGGSHGANPSNDPNRRVRLATAARRTGRSHRSAARSLRARTTAAAPSLGEQIMYWVSGGVMIRARMVNYAMRDVCGRADGMIAAQRDDVAEPRV